MNNSRWQQTHSCRVISGPISFTGRSQHTSHSKQKESTGDKAVKIISFLVGINHPIRCANNTAMTEQWFDTYVTGCLATEEQPRHKPMDAGCWVIHSNHGLLIGGA